MQPIYVEMIFSGLLLFYCPQATQATNDTLATPVPCIGEERADIDVYFVDTSPSAPACNRPYCDNENVKCNGSSINVRCADGASPCDNLVCSNGRVMCEGGSIPCPNSNLLCAESNLPSRCSALDSNELKPHFPSLVFALDYLAEAYTEYQVIPGPDGELAVYQLTDSCLEWNTGVTGGVDLEGGYAEGHRRPGNQGYGWLSRIREFDRNVGRFREKLLENNPSRWNDIVEAKLRLDEGTLEAASFPKNSRGQDKRWRACPENRPSASGSNLVRALPERVLFTQRLLGDSELILQTCRTGTTNGTKLFKFRASAGKVVLRWSNVPKKEHSGEPDHFRWYYELLRYERLPPSHSLPIPQEAEAGDSANYNCAVPASAGLFCPPTSYP